MGKMKIEQLKAREVCEAIKNGLGVAHFCVIYDCTEQEFERRLKQLYSKNEKDRKKKLAALRANDERLAKRAVKARESTSKNDESDYSEDLSTTDEVAAEEAEEIITVETATLEQLKAMEAELSDKLMLMETEHKEKARLQLHGIRKKYEEVTAQDNDLIARMNEISAEHYNKSAEIQRVRERIKELSKVVVFVYADGSITAENLDVNLDDTGSDELYRSLFEKDECGELRAKEIKTLARIVMISKHLPENTEVVFDNAEIEGVFRLLSA